MAKTWVTADHHFGHANIIKYCKRPFSSQEEMDEAMVRRWNSVVEPDDMVYHLGDFTLGGRDHFLRYVERLNGYIVFIPGGHDRRWVASVFPEDEQAFRFTVFSAMEIGNIPGYRFPATYCHYPMYSWEQSHHGAPHLHGHTHGTIGVMAPSGDTQLPPGKTQGWRMDVGVDNWEFKPLEMQRTLEKLIGKAIQT